MLNVALLKFMVCVLDFQIRIYLHTHLKFSFNFLGNGVLLLINLIIEWLNNSSMISAVIFKNYD